MPIQYAARVPVSIHPRELSAKVKPVTLHGLKGWKATVALNV
jgi:hypothetical protein